MFIKQIIKYNLFFLSSLPVAVFSGPDCSTDQKQLIQQCSSPLSDLRSQLDKMFQGGLQSVLKNLNGLSTLFQKGS